MEYNGGGGGRLKMATIWWRRNGGTKNLVWTVGLNSSPPWFCFILHCLARVTESWVEGVERISLSEIWATPPANFMILHQQRLEDCGGGIAVVYQKKRSHLPSALHGSFPNLNVFSWGWVSRTEWESYWHPTPPTPLLPNHFPAGARGFCLRCDVGVI